MPISTLCAKSMPSTYSRKPCTKCCRDISPSVTVSMPASSCSLSASKVASALAAASSSPESFHCGHSLLVSASHDGFGRLPAMVVPNMRFLGSASLWLPIIQPVVAAQEPFAAHRAQQHVAREAEWAAEEIARGIAPCFALTPHNPGGARPLIGAKGGRGVLALRKMTRQHGCVLDCHRAALGEKRQHRVCGVAQQRNRSLRANALRRAIEQSPFLPAFRNADQRARGRCETREGRQEIGGVSGCSPALSMPIVADDRHDVHHRAALDRIVHEMRIASEPKASEGRAQFAAYSGGGKHGPPRGAAHEARRLPVAQPST